MIEVRHLTKRYGSHTAVSDLSFTIENGVIYGFLGPNGAGNVQDRLIRNLSKGYRQRVGIAQALLGNPEVIILLSGFPVSRGSFF